MKAVRRASKYRRFKMEALLRTALVGLALLGVGCELFMAKETLYLKSAQDRAGQEDVRQHLGPPHLVAPTQAGESVWVYEVREIERGGNNSWSVTGSWCDEYVLTFDRQGILRSWTHKSQKHRDALTPTYCVRDGFKPES
jgi:hypothetical protein